MLVNADVLTAALIEGWRVEDVAAVERLVEGVGEQDVRELIAGVLEHVADIALALVIEEAVRGGVDVAEVLGAEGLDHIASLIVELAEVVRMRLDLDAQALALDDRQQFFHRAEPHAVADLLLVRVAGELRVDDGDAHVDGNLDHLLPVGDSHLALLFGRTGPAVDADEGRDLDARLLEGLAVLFLALLGEQRMFIEGVDARMRGLLDVLVAPVSDLMDEVVDAHLFGKNVNIKCDFHGKPSSHKTR